MHACAHGMHMSLMHACTHVNAHTNAHDRTHVYAHEYAHVCTHAPIEMMLKSTCVSTQAHVYARACLRACLHTRLLRVRLPKSEHVALKFLASYNQDTQLIRVRTRLCYSFPREGVAMPELLKFVRMQLREF